MTFGPTLLPTVAAAKALGLRLAGALPIFGCLISFVAVVHAEGPASAAMDGSAAYAQKCSACHGPSLEGSLGPQLAGPVFRARWTGRRSEELYSVIAQTMPAGKGGSLPPEQYRAIDNYILTANNFAENAPVLQGKATAAQADAMSRGEIQLPAPPIGAGRAHGDKPTDDEIEHAGSSDWLTYNRDYQGQRYSGVTGITPANVGSMKPKCMFQLGEIGTLEGSPIIYGNRLYITNSHNTYAIDASTCHKLWEYDYLVSGPEGHPTNRGPALYRGKLLRGTPDGHLLALDADDGSLLWDVWVADAAKGYDIAAAMVAFDGMVYLGQGGADKGVTGHIYAFDVETGRHVWTFDAVPTGNEPGAETWGTGAGVGGGSSWSTITVDPVNHQLYVPIGNPGSDIDGSDRPGDNLYTDSIVVLDAATGKLVWYVQQVPHDVWDYDTAAAPVLYEMNGRRYMAVASKAGWLFIYDRDTHRLVAKSETSSQLNSQKEPGLEDMRVCPGTLGGSEWNGPAFDPKRKLLMVNSVDWCVSLKVLKGDMHNNFGGTLVHDPIEMGSGWVRAFNAGTGDAVWRYHSDTPMIAAVTPLADGVTFTGTLNGELLGFNSTTGKVIYRFNTGGPIAGGLSAYSIDGRPYLAVTSGSASRTIWKSAGAETVIIFGLPEKN